MSAQAVSERAANIPVKVAGRRASDQRLHRLDDRRVIAACGAAPHDLAIEACSRSACGSGQAAVQGGQELGIMQQIASMTQNAAVSAQAVRPL
ncbi:MAG TPA: hypothetical protein VFP84_20195 [Kofleriaceae bacterium]|nr:hypothetical protein [Kofleriaceae bacterium]